LQYCFLILALTSSVGFSQSQEKSTSEIDRLNKQIANLQKTIESQRSEIERLQQLCRQYGIDVAPKQAIEKPTQTAISQPMFGVFLGETMDSLKKRLKVSESTYHFNDEDHPGAIWAVNVVNENVKQLLVYSFDNQIYTIDVRFSDGSRTNYETIKGQLENKYKQNDEGGVAGALFGEGVLKPVIDGIEVRIKLNHDTGFMEDDKLELSYAHGPLSDKVYKEIQRRKAAKINSEL